MIKTEKIEVRCPTCRDSLRPGLLWLGGKDYLTCPDCNGTTKVKILQTFFNGKPKRSLITDGLLHWEEM
jgi:DNA-directed RNA polymerase subunit RPC12/RpoP